MKKQGVFVTATGTEVGKTFFCALLGAACGELGVKAGYMKPVASGCRTQTKGSGCFDIDCVSAFFDGVLNNPDVCPVRYTRPLSPYAASLDEGERFDARKVMDSFKRLAAGVDFMVVEGVGGVMVPVCRDFFVTDLIGLFGLETIVVADAGLGTINHTLLTVDRLKAQGTKVACVVLNRCRNDRVTPDGPDVSVVSNAKVIEDLCGVRTLSLPEFDLADKPCTLDVLGQSGMLGFVKNSLL